MPAATREAQDSGLGKIQPSTGLNHETKKNIMLIIKGFVHNDQILYYIWVFACQMKEINSSIIITSRAILLHVKKKKMISN